MPLHAACMTFFISKNRIKQHRPYISINQIVRYDNGCGVIEWEKGGHGKSINVYPAPDKTTKPVGKQKFKAQIEIFEKQHENKGGSWYRINEKGDEQWVEAKYVTIDKFWEKKAAEQEKMDLDRQKDKDAKEKRAKEKADRIEKARKEWMEATDKQSGQKYWYNVETSETTWESPFK